METKKIDWIEITAWMLVIGLLAFNACNRTPTAPQLVSVSVPEVKGNFEPKTPENSPLMQNKNLPKNDKAKTDLSKFVKENKILKQEFIKLSDTAQVMAYESVIELNNFSSHFEDDNLEIDIEGVVQGEVKEITPRYKLKEREVEAIIKPKETVFRLLAGAEVGNNKEFGNFQAKANLMLQGRKGNMWTLSYDTNGTFWVGRAFSFLNIKR